ncbi:MAG TPA: hypothetical protein VK993_05655 [Chthoniobacterales bacterium]|nr:hypothetical protein [Chthoniobacterales bacterium]
MRHRVGIAAGTLAIVALLGALAVAMQQARISRTHRAKLVQRLQDLREITRSDIQPGTVHDALKQLDGVTNAAAEDPHLLREAADLYEKIASVQAGTLQTDSGLTFSGAQLGSSAAVVTQQRALSIREQLTTMSRNEGTDSIALANAYGVMADFCAAVRCPTRRSSICKKQHPWLNRSSPPTRGAREFASSALCFTCD